jgi:hypothetical protein
MYKTITSFNTSALPDNANIVGARLVLMRLKTSGANPMETIGSGTVDVVTGHFGAAATLDSEDFEAPATTTAVATMTIPQSNASDSVGVFNPQGRAAINKAGLTQIRVYLTAATDGDLHAEYMGFGSGEYSTPEYRPMLIVDYF